MIKFANKLYALTQPVGVATGVAPIVLENLQPSELLSIHNLIASNIGSGSTKRFADKSSAIRRTWAKLQEYQAWVEADEGGEPKQPETPAPTPPAPPAPPEPKPTVERKKRGMRFVFPAESEQKPVRADSARGKALALLQRKDGATFEEVQQVTGWNEKQAYEGIRLIHYYSGYGLAEDVKGDKTFIRAHTGKK